MQFTFEIPEKEREHPLVNTLPNRLEEALGDRGKDMMARLTSDKQGGDLRYVLTLSDSEANASTVISQQDLQSLSGVNYRMFRVLSEFFRVKAEN